MTIGLDLAVAAGQLKYNVDQVLGRKDTAGKAYIIQGAFHYFPRALAAVSALSDYGRKKYNTKFSERNFLFVEDAFSKYTDGLGRHLAGEVTDDDGVDPETDYPHMVAVAWNALARLEVALDQVAKLKKESRERLEEEVAEINRRAEEYNRQKKVDKEMAELAALSQKLGLVEDTILNKQLQLDLDDDLGG